MAEGTAEDLQLIEKGDRPAKTYSTEEGFELPESPDPEDGGPTGAEPFGSKEILSTQKVHGDIALAEAYEKAIDEVGFGKYQIALYFAIGFGLMADGAEIFIVGFIIPSAERDLCLNDREKGWLGGIVFVGMLLGALIWGVLSDKHGRRKCLLTALSVNALFAIISAFVKNYGFFLFCRLACGVGIGGSIPITFAYYSEFVAKSSRGANVTWLLFLWTCGGVYVSLIGWGIIPRTEISFTLSPEFTVHSWRIFVLLGSLPCLVAIAMLFCMEESPRYLLEVGRHDEAMEILKKVYKINHGGRDDFSVTEIRVPTRPQEFADIDKDDSAVKRFFVKLAFKIRQGWVNFTELLEPPFVGITSILLVCWFCTSFGYYGLTLWFPEYIKRLETLQYLTAIETTENCSVSDMTYVGRLENRHYINCNFTDVAFAQVAMNHVTFDNCLFRDTAFQDVTTMQTYFVSSTLVDCVFNYTDFYDFKFRQCTLENTRFYNLEDKCRIDFSLDYNPHTVYFESFISSLCGLPGCIVTALVIDRIGATSIYATFTIMCGVGAFFIWWVDTEISAVALSCIIQFMSLCNWSAIDVASTLLYPTSKRATAFGLLSAFSRVGGVLGNVSFGNFLHVSRAIPVLLAAAVFAVGGFLSLKLPDTRKTIMV
ncbi:synaptic vesicle glycoprotein 2C-like [Ptychodera flava]|uniref:synaptic vesicle glycoprotein 2C-like n=1 Tax=Ptychodera flava TaxID=63121 RepID=UPI003969D8DF